MSENHTREMELAIKDKAEMSENYLKEIDSLNRLLNAALRGTCSSGDMSSDGVLLMLGRKLSGFKLIKDTDYECHVKWFESRKLKESIESIGREAERGEAELLEFFSEILLNKVNYIRAPVGREWVRDSRLPLQKFCF